MKNRILHYIIRFLVGDDVPNDLVETIGYTADPNRFDQYNVVIIPSGFFSESVYGKPASLPQLPLREVQGIPLLFGSPKEEWVGDTWVVHADIIASTYFLISRYEEMMRRDVRDEYGRFPGRESLPYRAGFLHRPIVDEYRLLLHRWLRQSRLRVAEMRPRLRRVYLTHDVDSPTQYRSWRGMARSFLDRRGMLTTLRGTFGSLENDPFYTFPWLFRQNSLLQDALGQQRCQSVLFLRSGGKMAQDKPHYGMSGRDMKHLMRSALAHGVRIGLYSSYQAGVDSSLILREKENLEQRVGQPITLNRHRFLSCREPEDMYRLEAANVTDDFTMGYADVSGFRLGTCYPVRWINPVTRRLSTLRLHPLIIMDDSLENPDYMALGAEQALSCCLDLISQVYKVGGELVLAWHNDKVSEESDSYLRGLYERLIEELAKLRNEANVAISR